MLVLMGLFEGLWLLKGFPLIAEVVEEREAGVEILGF